MGDDAWRLPKWFTDRDIVGVLVDEYGAVLTYASGAQTTISSGPFDWRTLTIDEIARVLETAATSDRG